MSGIAGIKNTIYNQMPTWIQEELSTEVKTKRVALSLFAAILVGSAYFASSHYGILAATGLALFGVYCLARAVAMQDYEDPKELETIKASAQKLNYQALKSIHGIDNIQKYNIVSEKDLEKKYLRTLSSHLDQLKNQQTSLKQAYDDKILSKHNYETLVGYHDQEQALVKDALTEAQAIKDNYPMRLSAITQKADLIDAKCTQDIAEYHGHVGMCGFGILLVSMVIAPSAMIGPIFWGGLGLIFLSQAAGKGLLHYGQTKMKLSLIEEELKNAQKNKDVYTQGMQYLEESTKAIEKYNKARKAIQDNLTEHLKNSTAL